ncbi:MAG: GNAT family N-acetyltransferase [Streptosporangiaceae bacterium]
MELAVADNPEQAQFEIRADGELAGFLQYHLRDGVIALLHTQIDPRFRGHGVAGRLIQASLDAARERHLAVLPYCPFVRSWMTEHPEYADLVPGDRQPDFGL